MVFDQGGRIQRNGFVQLKRVAGAPEIAVSEQQLVHGSVHLDRRFQIYEVGPTIGHLFDREIAVRNRAEIQFIVRLKVQSLFIQLPIDPDNEVVDVQVPVLQSGISVAVPHTRSVNQLTQQRTVVTIDKNQNVFLQAGSRNGGADTPINLENLTVQLRSVGTADPTTRTIYVQADERVPFGAFASVMDAVKRAGITNISIVTQPIQSKTAN